MLYFYKLEKPTESRKVKNMRGVDDYETKAPEKMGVTGMEGPDEAVDLGQKDNLILRDWREEYVSLQGEEGRFESTLLKRVCFKY